MLQNLLPKNKKKKERQEYYLRLGTVVALMASVAVVVGLIALLPSYVKVLGALQESEAKIVARSENAKDSINLNKEVAKTATMLNILSGQLESEKVTELIKETLRLRPEGVRVVGYSYSRSTRELQLEGVAKSRELVAPYARSLENSDLFKEVPVPFSELAKNTDLNFHLTITLADTKL